jgi:hypothetical protein
MAVFWSALLLFLLLLLLLSSLLLLLTVGVSPGNQRYTNVNLLLETNFIIVIDIPGHSLVSQRAKRSIVL